MSVDALAATAAANAELAALVEAELAQLAADAQALRGQLLQDAVVTARVLPPNGLTDLLEVAGRRVAASLPPSVRPGEVLQVRVTGFDGERILLQVLGTGADVAVRTAPLPPPVAQVSIPSATPSAPQAPPSSSTLPATSGSSSLSGTPPAPTIPNAAPQTKPQLGTSFTSVVSRANVAPSIAPTGAAPGSHNPAITVRTVVVPGEPTSIEARVAAARAAMTAPPEAPATPAGESPIALPSPVRGFVAPPQIAPKGAAPAPPAAIQPHVVPAPVAGARASGLAAYTEPVALLRALRLPVTPTNVAAATLALSHPERLPSALEALERALPRATIDPSIATLRTLLGFVGRIDPRSPALAAQIAAYVEHVVDGPEPKLATLLAASRAAIVEPDPDAPPPSRSNSPEPPRPLPSALAAERAVALDGDLKQTLLNVAANPATHESLAPSLAGALTALTAMQLGAAQTLAAHPDGLAFTIPLATPNGTSNAHISVKRDAPEGARMPALDAGNFHIAFILETAHYGQVAIDLVTVGREVMVDVRTDSAPAMRAFRDMLGDLTSRLEALRYRVAAASASVGPTSTIAVASVAPARLVDPDATVDRSA